MKKPFAAVLLLAFALIGLLLGKEIELSIAQSNFKLKLEWNNDEQREEDTQTE